MIPRYTKKEMAVLWTDEKRLATWLKVELAVMEAQEEMGLVPKGNADHIRKKAEIRPSRVLEIEATVKHDVIAFLTQVGETVGEPARFMHYGLTSSDVVDTAQSLLLLEAMDLILKTLGSLREALRKRAEKHQMDAMVGRTHGIHAEPVTLGLVFARYYASMTRCEARLKRARKGISVGKLSGAVGTFAHQDPGVETIALSKLGLCPEGAASQVIPRDRLAEVMTSMAITASCLEEIAVEIRHLQRTEVREVEEAFSKGQKGSSAMPHKRNPILSENLTGLARLVRSYCLPALENIALWHERDISHSSVERVILPDATATLHFALHRAAQVIENLQVYPKAMKANLERTRGLVYSQRVLLALAREGMAREKAYALVQSSAMEVWEGEGHLLERLMEDPQIVNCLGKEKLRDLFQPEGLLQHVPMLIQRALSQEENSCEDE